MGARGGSAALRGVVVAGALLLAGTALVGCAREPAPGLELEPVQSYPGVSLPAHAWSPDGRAFALLVPGGGLEIATVAQPEIPPRLVTNRRVTELAWSPGGTRLALRVPTHWRPSGVTEFDVLVIEHDSLRTTVLSKSDARGLAWLSDTSLWVRRASADTLDHVISFPPSPGGAGGSATVATGWLTFLPASPPSGAPLLVGPRASLPARTRAVPGAPRYAVLAAPSLADFQLLATHAGTKRLLGRRGGSHDAELLDSAGRRVRRVPEGGKDGFEALSFAGDGTILLGRAPDATGVGRPTGLRAAAANGRWPATDVKGPQVVDVQGAPRGDLVLLGSSSVWLARLLVSR